MPPLAISRPTLYASASIERNGVRAPTLDPNGGSVAGNVSSAGVDPAMRRVHHLPPGASRRTMENEGDERSNGNDSEREEAGQKPGRPPAGRRNTLGRSLRRS